MAITNGIFIGISFPVGIALYYVLGYLFASKLIQKLWMVLGSLGIYFYLAQVNIGYIVFSFLFNFLVGWFIRKQKKGIAAWVYYVAVLLNICLWVFVKYRVELTDAYSFMFASFTTLNHWIVPLGFGLITLQQLSFLSDCYTKNIEAVSVVDYLCFATFFPKLIAGPLIGYSAFTAQLNNAARNVNYQNIAQGIYVVFVGLLQKLLFADTFLQVADRGFACHSLNIAQAWITALCNLFGIYFDISGYTYMAIGLGLCFNIMLPQNFNYPFKALNIRDFWDRWHITFTGFFKQSIVSPIVGNTKRGVRYAFGITVMFLAMALWHKLNFPIVVWALLHACALIVFALFNRLPFSLPKYLAWLITFGFVMASMLFFRVETLSQAYMIVAGLANVKGLFIYYNEFYILWGVGANFMIVLLLVVSFIVVMKFKNLSDLISSFQLTYKTVCITILLMVFYFVFNSVQPFIYYGF